ncbi:MAG: amidase [Pyrinomonadaceae bacterium]
MDELTSQSATKLAEMICTRAISPVEVVSAHLQRIERMNPSLNAIVTLAPDALERAREAETIIMRGGQVGPLHGVPLTIKDTIETQGLRTTSGSRILKDFIPTKDATVVARLKTAGAIILGKTNTPEMAIPYETDNPVFGRTNNPHDVLRTPGGSSGGEAAAIAAGLSPAGIGSDLSGSIRVPAHFCGIAGLKPSSGRVPMDGHIPIAALPLSIGACIGPMARRVEDLSLLFQVIADPKAPSDHKPFVVSSDYNLRGLRAAWYVNDGVAPVTDETSRAVKAVAAALSDAGAETFEAAPPSISEGPQLWIELFSTASMDQLREFYRGHEDEAGQTVQSLLAVPAESNAGIRDLRAAIHKRDRLRGSLLEWMAQTPIIIAPVGAAPAFPHGTRRIDLNGAKLSPFRAFSYCQAYNVFDLPSVCVPAGHSPEGLPIGVQIVGRPDEDEFVLAVAAICQNRLR